MRVRMRTTMAGPERTVIAGKVADLPDAEARDLIKGGYAEAVGKAAAPERPKPETAAAPGPEESAVSKAPARPRKGRSKKASGSK